MSDEGRRLIWELVLARNIFFIWKKKKFINNLSYGEIFCLEIFCNYCIVFISFGKVCVGCFFFVVWNIGKDDSSSWGI